MAEKNEEIYQQIEDALNHELPDGYDEFDDFVKVVSGADFKCSGEEEWTLTSVPTGQREDPNDWSSPMRIGMSIQIPEIDAIAIWDTWEWEVKSIEEV